MIKWLIITIISFQYFLNAHAQEKIEPEAYIILDSFSLEKSRFIDAAVVIRLEDGWHIYWRNPGDSGMPTSFEFILPEKISVSEIKWTVPKIFEFEGYASYGYEGIAVFPFSIYIPENFNQDEITIELNLRSLICKDVCKPFNKKLSKTINLKKNFVADNSVSDLISNASKNIPIKNDKLKLRAKNHSDYVAINISSEIIKINKIRNVHFIPYENGIFKNSVTQNFSISDSVAELIVEFDPFKTKVPEFLSGILVIELISEEGNSSLAFEVNEKIE
jgi:thiol:disulfide interchange protein DsbD